MPRHYTNEQAELYCMNILKGMRHIEAYKLICHNPNGKPESLKHQAKIFHKSLRIKETLARLRREFLAPAVMTIEERRLRASEIGRANITDYVDADGNIKVSQDSPNKGAIAEYAVRERKFGTDRDIKLLNPLQAIDLLNKMDGLYDDRPQVNQTLNINVTKVIIGENNGTKPFKELISGDGSSDKAN